MTVQELKVALQDLPDDQQVVCRLPQDVSVNGYWALKLSAVSTQVCDPYVETDDKVTVVCVDGELAESGDEEGGWY